METRRTDPEAPVHDGEFLVTYRVTCTVCCYEETVEDLEAVFEAEREHQEAERLSHVLEFERVSDGVD